MIIRINVFVHWGFGVLVDYPSTSCELSLFVVRLTEDGVSAFTEKNEKLF